MPMLRARERRALSRARAGPLPTDLFEWVGWGGVGWGGVGWNQKHDIPKRSRMKGK
jgi:hypothetical protein